MRSCLSLVVAASLLPSLTLAGGTVTPPKGWIRDKPYEAKTQATLSKQYGDGITVRSEVWRMKDDGGDPSLQTMSLLIADPTVVDDLDAMLQDIATSLEPKLTKAGWVTKPSTPAKRKGLKSIARAYEGQGHYIRIEIQSIPAANKALLVYFVTCFEDVGMKNCDKAIATMKVTK